MDINIEKYTESLEKYLDLVSEAKEGRYDITGYDLHVIEAALSQYLNSDSNILGDILIASRNLESMTFKNETIRAEMINKLLKCIIGDHQIKVPIEIDGKKGNVIKIDYCPDLVVNGLTQNSGIAIIEFEIPTKHQRIYLLETIMNYETNR